MKITLDTNNFQSPESMGLIVSYYLYDCDSIDELTWEQLEYPIQKYFGYLDRDERKDLRAQKCPDTGIVMCEWKGDRYITDGKRNVCAPNYYKDSIWLFTNNEESMRFELDLEEILYGDEEEPTEEGFFDALNDIDPDDY